jgi:hypothetical protein
MHLLNFNKMNLLVKGCINCYEFKISYKDIIQYIYLFGESHHFQGNSLDIIDFFINNTNCPIQILNEADRSIENPNRNYCFSDKSNVVLIHQKYNKCSSLKFNTPKDKDIPDNFNYIKQCIIPLKGRVKFWNMDLRSSPFFSLLQTNQSFLNTLSSQLEINMLDKLLLTDSSIDRFKYNVSIIKTKYESKIDLMKFNNTIFKMEQFIEIYKLLINVLFNFKLYNKNLLIYHLKIYDLGTIERIPRHIIKLYFPYLFKLLNNIINNKGNLKFTENEKYKNHLYLMESLNYLVDDSLTQIFHFLDFYSFTSLVFNCFYVDIYSILRIIRLIRENKSQYILGFYGDSHAHFISVLLSISTIFQYKTDDKNHYKIKGKVYPFDIKNPNKYIKIKKIHNCKKSERMLLYQNLIKKNKKNIF